MDPHGKKKKQEVAGWILRKEPEPNETASARLIFYCKWNKFGKVSSNFFSFLFIIKPSFYRSETCCGPAAKHGSEVHCRLKMTRIQLLLTNYGFHSHLDKFYKTLIPLSTLSHRPTVLSFQPEFQLHIIHRFPWWNIWFLLKAPAQLNFLAAATEFQVVKHKQISYQWVWANQPSTAAGAAAGGADGYDRVSVLSQRHCSRSSLCLNARRSARWRLRPLHFSNHHISGRQVSPSLYWSGSGCKCVRALLLTGYGAPAQ